MRISLASVFLITILTIGCNKTDTPPDAADQASTPTVLLEQGKGALLITYPKPHRFQSDRWMAQVTITGPHETNRLPRTPMADIQALAVLNIEPGTYSVISESWMRKYPPSSGGSSDNVIIRPGEIIVLKANPLGMETRPYRTVPLDFVAREKWSLTKTEKFRDYMSSLMNVPREG